MSVVPSIQLHYAALSDTGKVRSHNEDSLLCRPDLHLWAVADGMGGLSQGEVASALACQTLAEQVALGQSLEQGILAAHQAICQHSTQSSMGSTLVAALFNEQGCTLAWVGDSRAYRISGEGIEQLSHDHSWVQCQIDIGRLTPEQARSHSRRNIITQCLGQHGEAPQPSVEPIELLPGQLLLLCSDGLHSELEDQNIMALAAQAPTLQELVQQLIEGAKAQGGRDNISAIVLSRQATLPEPANTPKRGLLAQLFNPRLRAKS